VPLNNFRNCIIASTSKYIVAIDPYSAAVRVIDGFRGIYYGIAWCPDRRKLFCCTRNSVTGPTNKLDREHERGSILVFDEKLVFIKEIVPPFPLRDLHSMCIVWDKLYMACSFDNMIAIYDLNEEVWSQWYPHPDPRNRNADINHINSIAFEQDCFQIVAHNWGVSQIMKFDHYHHLIESCVLGKMAHDSWLDGSYMCTLSSGEGLVRSQKRILVRTNGFPRGFCRVDSRYAVGISAPSTPSERLLETGFIRIYSKDWEIYSEIVLPSVGMVNQLISVPDILDAVSELVPLRPIIYNDAEEKFDPNYYYLGKSGFNVDLAALGWHERELSGCWTASKRAHITVIITSKILALEISVAGFQGGVIELMFDDIVLGEICIESETSSACFLIPIGCSPGEHTVGVKTERLVKPDNGDQRLIGAFVHYIRLIPLTNG
jgi:hypothetical protein